MSARGEFIVELLNIIKILVPHKSNGIVVQTVKHCRFYELWGYKYQSITVVHSLHLSEDNC